MSLIRWFLSVLFVIGVGGNARADKVDWSQYTEPAGYKTPSTRTPAVVKAEPKPTKVAKQAPAKPAAKVAKRAKPAKAKAKR
jgi:hypothetical protein